MTKFFHAYSPVPFLADNELLGFWQLDETGGTTAIDSVLGNHGTYAGDFTLASGSLLDDGSTCPAFGGVSGRVMIPHNPAYEVGEVSVVLAVRPNGLPAFNAVCFAKAGLPEGGTRVGETSIEVMVKAGQLLLRGYVQDTFGVNWIGAETGIDTGPVPVGAIRQILFEMDATGARLSLRAPGGEWEQVAENELANTGWGINFNPIHFATYDDTGGFFNGFMDHVRVYRGILTAEQKNALPRPLVSQSLTLAPVAAFSTSRQRLTTLPGWSGTPKEIATQGQRVHAYLRRTHDYAPDNDGTYIDIVAGGRRTTSPDTISVRLMDNSVIDLSINVTRATPSPARVLDRTGAGGPDFTTWGSAIAGLTTNETLLVRARTGTWTDLAGFAIPNSVYPVATKPSSGVNGCKIIGHPDDVAAGRIPTVMWEGERYARYVYALTQEPWELHQTLGNGDTIWRTKQTHPAAATYCGFYRAPFPKIQPGDPNHNWVALFSPRYPSQTSRLAVLQDTTHAPVSNWTNASQPYRGPSLIQEPDGRFYVRLSPPVQQVIQNPAYGAPWPTWAWQQYYPPSHNPNAVQIWIAVGNNGGGFANRNWLVGIAGRSGWEFENIGFFDGNTAVYMENATGALPKFRGVYFGPGGTTGDFFENSSDPGHGIDAGAGLPSKCAFTTLVSTTADAEFDQCQAFGGCAPWMSWMDGKGGYGPGGQAARREFISLSTVRAVYRNSVFHGFWHHSWLGNNLSPPTKSHFVHCLLRYWGSHDGAFVSNGYGDYLIGRSRIELAIPGGIASGGGVLFTMVNNISFDNAAHTITYGGAPPQTIFCSTWPSSYQRGVPSFPGGMALAHGSNSGCDAHHAQNLCIGTAPSNGDNLFGGSLQGSGSGMTPNFRNRSGNSAMAGSMCFNNIGVLVPTAYPWPVGRSAAVAGYAGNWTVKANFNHIWKVTGVYTLSGAGGINNLVMAGTGSTAVGYASLSALASDTGHEVNGTSGNAGFAGGAPAYISSNPFVPGGAFDLARYLLVTGAACRTGGSTALAGHAIKDYDLGTQVTYAGKAWRGPLAPDVPVIEQRIGLLAPAMLDPVG